jgi:hypothetical protein
MIPIPCTLTLSDSGKIAQIFHTNGRLIAELLIHGPLRATARNCHESRPILTGRPNVYRGEVFGLAGYEYLNIESERIEEKTI